MRLFDGLGTAHVHCLPVGIVRAVQCPANLCFQSWRGPTAICAWLSHIIACVPEGSGREIVGIPHWDSSCQVRIRGRCALPSQKVLQGHKAAA